MLSVCSVFQAVDPDCMFVHSLLCMLWCCLLYCYTSFYDTRNRMQYKGIKCINVAIHWTGNNVSYTVTAVLSQQQKIILKYHNGISVPITAVSTTFYCPLWRRHCCGSESMASSVQITRRAPETVQANRNIYSLWENYCRQKLVKGEVSNCVKKNP
jgi:hypothetical protein